MPDLAHLYAYLAQRRQQHARSLALWETTLRGPHAVDTEEIRLVKAELRAALAELDAIETFLTTIP